MKRYYFVLLEGNEPLKTFISCLYENYEKCLSELRCLVSFIPNSSEIEYWICETDINYDKI